MKKILFIAIFGFINNIYMMDFKESSSQGVVSLIFPEEWFYDFYTQISKSEDREKLQFIIRNLSNTCEKGLRVLGQEELATLRNLGLMHEFLNIRLDIYKFIKTYMNFSDDTTLDLFKLAADSLIRATIHIPNELPEEKDTGVSIENYKYAISIWKMFLKDILNKSDECLTLINSKKNLLPNKEVVNVNLPTGEPLTPIYWFNNFYKKVNNPINKHKIEKNNFKSNIIFKKWIRKIRRKRERNAEQLKRLVIYKKRN